MPFVGTTPAPCAVFSFNIPNWLATEGMGREKIEMFYDDPVKTACDDWSIAKAWHLRSLSIDNGLTWRARRWMRFVMRLAQGLTRSAKIGARPSASQPPGGGKLA